MTTCLGAGTALTAAGAATAEFFAKIAAGRQDKEQHQQSTQNIISHMLASLHKNNNIILSDYLQKIN